MLVVISSLTFFGIVFGSPLATADDPATMVLGALFLLVFGSMVAISIVLVSLAIAVVSGVVTSLAKRAVRR